MTRTALIIEDDILIAMELEEILNNLGFEVEGTCITEDKAVDTAMERRPDLLLVDYRLAEGDGVSAVERISGTLDVRIVFVTANSDELRRRRPDAIRVDKPFDHDTIARAIRAVFGEPSGALGP